ncbi:DUF6383 domain-containing protein [Massilibacteroides vaginae]|uniref:DUF6383 domain-containing protein n=1 Tax=Massilibacteroides vaginae TaxID=1673718 RepID=UPI000A1CA040|nr:DUF6383 domain-containing protein [Massilibacteroides vaginae]
MNKKIFTLFAAAAALGIGSSAYAQHAGLSTSAEIPYRTQAVGSASFDATQNDLAVKQIESTKWYQLEVTDASSTVPGGTGTKVLVQMRDYDTGELTLKAVDQSSLTTPASNASLNASLWKINVVSRTQGAYLYEFTNKETGFKLSYNCNDAVKLDALTDLSASSVITKAGVSTAATVNKTEISSWRWYTADVNATGDFDEAKLYTFNHGEGADERVLGLAINTNDEVVLVDIPSSQVTGAGNAMVAGYNILNFTVRNAGARVLSAADINSMIDSDNSLANRTNTALNAKFKLADGTVANDFFKSNYTAVDVTDTQVDNATGGVYAGYSVVLKDGDKYLMVATDETYENDQLPSQHSGFVVKNDVYPPAATTPQDPATTPINALSARYIWKVTYFPTPDSLAFEPLNASIVSDEDKKAGTDWLASNLSGAAITSFYNTVNAGVPHGAGAAATATTNTVAPKLALEPVALTLMNKSTGIDSKQVLSVGSSTNPLAPAHATAKYGKPVLTNVPAEMGLKVQFDHTYTYLERAAVASDVYMIQINVSDNKKTDYRKNGMYLVYNMEGRLMYDRPDDNQDYLQMPATQWVVERDTCAVNNDAPYVTIRNREYGDQTPAPLFKGQLYKVAGSTDKYYIINHRDYDVKSNSNGLFADAHLSCGDTISFTAVPAAIKADPYLGYKKFNAESLKYETYAMQYLQATELGAPNTDKFLSIDGDSKLLGIKTELWSDFEIDTLYANNFGYASALAGAVQLERSSYSLKVKDANLVDNQWRYVVVKEDANGNSYYQMAHLKDVDGKNVKLGTFYFKADQVTSDNTPVNAYALVDATGWSQTASFKKEYWINGKTYAGLTVMAKDSMMLEANPDESGVYAGRKFFENGFKRADVKDQNAKVSFASLNTAPMDRVSAFVFTDNPRPLYKTLSLEGNNTVSKVFRQRGANAEATEYLFEDGNNAAGLNAGEYIKGFNYLGITAENVKPVGKESTTAFYIDSVISSNPRMPKYLFFVAPDSVKDGRWCSTNQHGYFPSESTADENDKSHHVFYNGYLAGRVMINLNDSIDKYAGHNMLNEARSYGYRNYSRLGFVEAIHMNVTAEEAAQVGKAFDLSEGEYLFVFKSTTIKDVTSKWNVVDPAALNDAVNAGKVDKIVLNDAHQNVAFSLRLTDDSQETILLESKGLNVTGSYGTFSEASWVQILDGVPVLAQKYNINGDHTEIDGTSTLNQLLNQAQILRIANTDDRPTSNEDINATDVKVIAGNGNVTILNAAGKTVSINNILGQVVAKTTITSDNATISAPKGIVVVAIQGEDAIKAIVK